MTYVRVKDPSTGHEFDVLETSVMLRKELVKRVKADRYPPVQNARAPKYRLDLAGQSATRSAAPSPEETAPATNPEEH